MHHQLLTAATLLAAVANSSKTFHIGPWIIVPTLILVAIIGTPIYIVRDRRKRRAEQRTR
jgi:Flp pilus assembly protein TadB